MTPELQRAIKRYRLWFGSYRRSGELIRVQVWLTVYKGQIEFLTPGDSYKIKRIRVNRGQSASSERKTARLYPAQPKC